MIFHGVFHKHGLAFMINGMMISWPFWMQDPLKGGANFECWGKGNAARIRAAMSDVLDRCRAHLDLVGFGPREMATLDINDSGEIAKQIAFELNITPGQELEDAIVDWIQEAREPARLAMRLEGVLASDIEWSRLQTRRRFGPATTQEPAPPPGDRIKKLELSGNELLAREEKLLDMWAKRLRLWLQEAKLLSPPGRPIDLVDYLLVRRDEPCGRSVPETIMKAISWFEKIPEFRLEVRATEGRIAWATKDKIIVEMLSEGAPLTKRAPRYPTWVLVKIES